MTQNSEKAEGKLMNQVNLNFISRMRQHKQHPSKQQSFPSAFSLFCVSDNTQIRNVNIVLTLLSQWVVAASIFVVHIRKGCPNTTGHPISHWRRNICIRTMLVQVTTDRSLL